VTVLQDHKSERLALYSVFNLLSQFHQIEWHFQDCIIDGRIILEGFVRLSFDLT